jgi:tRNA (guanine-N7-)-methyltransferase
MSEHFRPIKTYVKRSGRITDSQYRDYTVLGDLWCVPYKQEPLDFAALFGNGNPVVCEIGFGMGKATAQIALDNPQINYLGIEVYKNGVGRLLGDIQRLHLRNLYLIEWDALDVLADQIPDGSIAGFHIFFPDPWPKTKHHKRRLMQRPNTDLLAQKLVPPAPILPDNSVGTNNYSSLPGYLYFVTDWEPYAASAKEQLDATPALRNKYDGFAPPQLWRPETKFEAKGKQEEREIHELVYERDIAQGA